MFFGRFAEDSQGRKSVVIAGGYAEETYSMDTDIFDLETETWHKGNIYRGGKCCAGSSTQQGKTFVTLGGDCAHAEGDGTHGVYKYNPDTEDWLYQGQLLKYSRSHFGAELVPDTHANCV